MCELSSIDNNEEQMNDQFKPLVDDINTLNVELIRLTNDQLIWNCRDKLEQWRDNYVNIINDLYEKKLEELNRYATKQIDDFRIKINEIRMKLNKLMFEQNIINDDFEMLTLNIYDLKRNFLKLKEKSFEINFQPIKFDDNLIQINQIKINELDLSKLSKSYRIINSTKQSRSTMISNDQYLLIDHYPHLIFLNQDLKIIKHILWPYGFIRNMSWSSALSTFVIINNEQQVYFINQHTFSIEHIDKIEKQYWWSCTFSDVSLFLTNTNMGTNIYQYNLIPSVELIQQWKPPISCKQNEFIDDIKYNNGTLGLVIKVSSTNTVHFELRSSKTLEQIWKIQLNINQNWFQQTIRCCPLKYDQWLIIEGNTSHLFHILNNGKLKIMGEYQPSPINAVLFGSNILVIRSKDKIFFHRL